MSKQHKIVVCLCGVTQLNLALWPNYCPSIHIYRNYRIYRIHHIYIVSVVYTLYRVVKHVSFLMMCCVPELRACANFSHIPMNLRALFFPPLQLRCLAVCCVHIPVNERQSVETLEFSPTLFQQRHIIQKKKRERKKKRRVQVSSPSPLRPTHSPPTVLLDSGLSRKVFRTPKTKCRRAGSASPHGCSSAGGARCLSPPD